MPNTKPQIDLEELVKALRPPEKQENSLTKNVITIGVSLITAALMFCGTFIYQSNAKITEMGVTLKYMSDSVDELKKKVDDSSNQFVTRNEFEKTRNERTIQLNDIESRVRALESTRRK